MASLHGFCPLGEREKLSQQAEHAKPNLFDIDKRWPLFEMGRLCWLLIGKLLLHFFPLNLTRFFFQMFHPFSR
jgi:hypothetical protein